MKKDKSNEKKKHFNICRFFKYVLAFVIFLAIALKIKLPTLSSAASYAKVIEIKAQSGSDITGELQEALNEAAKAGTKKKQALVKVPKGEFYISRSLVIGSNTYLKLSEETTVKKNPKAKDPILYMLMTKQGTKGKYSDNARITVAGGKWDAEFIKYNTNTGGSVFMFAHTTTLKILNVTLCNCFGSHLIELGGVKKCTIKGCELYGYEASAEGVEKEAIQLDICHSKDIIDSGAPFDDTPCLNVTIKECSIHDYSRAVGSHTMVEGIYHKTVKITDNHLYDLTDAAVYGYNYAGLTVKGNTIENTGAGIQVKSDSVVAKTKLARNSGVKAMKISGGNFNLKVTDNIINLNNDISQERADSGLSIGIFIYGSETYPMKKVTISGNDITSNSSGVYLRYTDNATIKNNTVRRHKTAPAAENTKFSEDALKLLASKNAVIIGNTVQGEETGLFENGIALRDASSAADLSGNIIKGSQKSGLALYDGSKVSGGSENELLNSGLNGITVIGSALTFDSGIVDTTVEHGISVRSGSSLTINNGRISNAGSNGINIGADSEVTISNLTIEKSTSKGINVMEGGNLKLETSKVFDSGSKGIDIAGDSVVKITGCDIEGNGDSAVFIDGNTETDITDCTISNNKGNAIQFKQGNAAITGNTITDNCLSEIDGKAVAVFGGAKGTISQNFFSNPNTKSELWISAEADLTPYLSTIKTAKAYGTVDEAGNQYGA